MLLMFIVLLLFAKKAHLRPHKQIEHRRQRLQRPHYRPRPISRTQSRNHRQSLPPKRLSRQAANRSRKPVYFHDIYQQYAPNYPNYAPPKSYFGSQSDRDKLLAIHKRVRGRTIRWNPQIARLAQMHANGCPSGHANLPRGASGQNMAWTGTMEDSANMWASEGPSGGHYRIMRNYQSVGCGISRSCSVVVCDYQ